MNKYIISSFRLITIAGFLLLGSCTGFFEEYNINQHQATEEMMLTDNLKSGSFFSQMQRNVVLFDEQGGGNLSSSYQVAQGLTADIYAGYYAPTGTWYGGLHNGCYNFIDGWITQTFRSGFEKVMPAWQAIVKVAEDANLPELAALATVVKVQAMHRVADSYGPIPYINFGTGQLQNDYDDLEDIYKKFFEELDNAIDVLTSFAASPSATILAKYDMIYGGNVTSWVKFANTLRLRLAMRVVKADEALAKEQAEKSAAHPFGFVSTPSERATLKRMQIDYWHPLYDIKDFNAGEARMSAAMDSYLRGYEDPRISVYFQQVEVPHPNAPTQLYRGARLGVVTTNMAPYVGTDVSKLNVNRSTEIVWMTAAESYFLRAEGALRGWEMGGTAQSFYEAGIQTSFDENGVSFPDYFITNRTPVNYVIPTGQGMTGAISVLAGSSSTLWSDTDNFDVNLGRIITQKWIAIYPDGPEAWAEYRRTGFPRLFPVVTNNSNGTINTNTQVRRIPYPQSEYNLNAAGVQTGISKLRGPDTGGTRLWWDKI